MNSELVKVRRAAVRAWVLAYAAKLGRDGVITQIHGSVFGALERAAVAAVEKKLAGLVEHHPSGFRKLAVC